MVQIKSRLFLFLYNDVKPLGLDYDGDDMINKKIKFFWDLPQVL